jgi:hypothetical protein
MNALKMLRPLSPLGGFCCELDGEESATIAPFSRARPASPDTILISPFCLDIPGRCRGATSEAGATGVASDDFPNWSAKFVTACCLVKPGRCRVAILITSKLAKLALKYLTMWKWKSNESTLLDRHATKNATFEASFSTGRRRLAES